MYAALVTRYPRLHLFLSQEQVPVLIHTIFYKRQASLFFRQSNNFFPES